MIGRSWAEAGIRRGGPLLALVLMAGLGGVPHRSARADHVIHFLVVGDTKSGLYGMQLNLDHLRNAIIGNIADKSLYRITTLVGDQVQPQQILGTISGLRVDPTDAVVMYYLGHGAVDPNQGHYLATSGGPLVRSQLRQTLQGTGAQLAVLMTDCCSTVAPIPSPKPEIVVAAPMYPPEVPRIMPWMRNLFLEHRGLVDITAAETGEAAWYTTTTGGLFTEAVTSALGGGVLYMGGDLGGGGDGEQENFVTWSRFHDIVRRQTNLSYKDFRSKYESSSANGGPLIDALRSQTDQRPEAFSLAERGPSVPELAGEIRPNRGIYAPNLGVTVEPVRMNGSLGLRLTQAAPAGSPLAALGFERGDTITRLDGLPLRHEVDVLSHVGGTTMEFINVRDGRRYPANINLPNQVMHPDWAPLELFAPNLGIYYRMIPSGMTTPPSYHARLSRLPVPGSPIAAIQLETGDMITKIDDLYITSPYDVINHVDQTSIEFIDIRTGQLRKNWIRLPSRVPDISR